MLDADIYAINHKALLTVSFANRLTRINYNALKLTSTEIVFDLFLTHKFFL